VAGATKTLLTLLALLLSAPLSQAAFTELGTDAAGDDEEALTAASEPAAGQGAIIPCPGDCTNIDDVLALAVDSTDSELLFLVTIAELPADSTLLQGQYCWVAAFQVQGNDEEFIAMVCEDYVNGEGTAVEDDTSRGTEVASGHEWADGAAQIVIHVPFANIDAGPGTVIEDIYALTYISDSLFVDDAAPDGKSDRDADDNFGTYTIPSSSGGSETGSDTETATGGTTTSSSSSSSTSAATTSSGTKSTTAATTSAPPTSAASSTTAAGDGESKDSPAPPLAWVALGLGLAAVAVRRRLR
jgi:hypothetical protein